MHRGNPARRLAAALTLTILGLGLAPAPARACSMCRCSDPVFSALGEGLYSYGGFQVALDWNRLDQTQGEAHEGRRIARKHGEGFEEQVRNTMIATLSYGFRERFTIVAQVPYTWNELTEGHEVETAEGLGDPAFFAYFRLWSSPFQSPLGRRAWISAVFSVKTPWGENDVSEDGERLDEHVQPGTGATNLSGGLAGLYLIDEKSSLYALRGLHRHRAQRLRLQVRRQRPGQPRLRPQAHRLARRRRGAELPRRGAATRSTPLGVPDPDTGGQSLYVTPRVGVNVVRGLVARAAAQFPVWENLNGIQDIKPAFTAGLTYVF